MDTYYSMIYFIMLLKQVSAQWIYIASYSILLPLAYVRPFIKTKYIMVNFTSSDRFSSNTRQRENANIYEKQIFSI